MYVCMHACMHGCMYVCMYVCLYVSMYLCIFDHFCIYVFVYVYIATPLASWDNQQTASTKPTSQLHPGNAMNAMASATKVKEENPKTTCPLMMTKKAIMKTSLGENH